MDHERINRHSNTIHRQHDDWDEVHNQLLAIQKKSLQVSNPDDADEKEADEVARKVVTGQSAKIHGSGTTINRKGEGEFETTTEFQSQLQSSKGSGQSLDDSTRSEMESKMGADFSGVKIHTGSEANSMNQNIHAKAFTHGQDVFFNQGEFDTGSKQGKELLAHELTHTVQQGSGKTQPGIQRKHGNNQLTVDVTGPMLHADGVYNATLGTLRTPKDDAGYTETFKTTQEDLYDTYYSIAIRFGIDVKDVMAENPDRPEKKIFHDIDIFIPDIAPTTIVQTQPPVATEPQTAEEVLTPSGPKSITPQEELKNIKSGIYNGNPQAQYDAAKRVLTTNYFGPRPKERELLNEIIAKNGNVTVDPLYWAHTYDDFKRYDPKTKKDVKVIAADVQKTAWEIVKSDAQIRHTYEFLHKIKRDEKQDERDKELYKFFENGEYKPSLKIENIDNSGETPSDNSDEHHKIIRLNDANSFTVDVATYLHELNHYMDILYSSAALPIKDRKAGREMGKGIKPEKATEVTDLDKTEQQQALAESLNATIAQILLEMQRDPRPNDHPRVEGNRAKDSKYKNMSFRASYRQWEKNTGSKETLDEFIMTAKSELATAAVSPDVYEAWGAQKDDITNDIITTNRIELGFAFEKMAYGFDTGTNGEWAVDLIQKFEEKYFTFLEDR